MEHGTPAPATQNLNDWDTVIAVLKDKNLSLEEFVYPERHKGQQVTAKRIAAIKAMNKLGISRNRLTTIGPYSTQYIGRILQNGSGANEVDRNLPFEDTLLSLPPQE
jgi:hypothetical protein